MKYDVVHETMFFERRTLFENLDFDEAKVKTQEIAKVRAHLDDDGLGQTINEEYWPPARPFQIVVETMTAEAGYCTDVYAVIPR
jgi:hypothetical protein